MGPKITVSDKSITNDSLFKSKNYKWHRDDNYNFDIFNLPKSVAELNNYFRTKKKINPETKKPIYGKFANIDIIQAKLSKCSSMLSAGNKRAACLNFEYEWKIGDKIIIVYRQLGPIQYFIENKSLVLPFISILNMLELVHTVTDAYLDEYHINLERMSLLVKDLTKKEFDAITSIDPSEITFKPITEETLATEATLLSPTRIPEPFTFRDQGMSNADDSKSKGNVKESAPAAPATTPAPAAPTPTPVPAATPAPPAPPLPPVSRKINRFNVTINKI